LKQKIILAFLFLSCKQEITDDQRAYEEREITKALIQQIVHPFPKRDFERIMFFEKRVGDSTVGLDSELFGELKEFYSGSWIRPVENARLVVKTKDSNFTDGTDGAFVKETMTQGEILTIGKIRWISNEMVEVKYSTWRGLLAGAGYTVILKKANHKWEIFESKMDYIS
jgi:hypothetical protein